APVPRTPSGHAVGRPAGLPRPRGPRRTGRRARRPHEGFKARPTRMARKDPAPPPPRALIGVNADYVAPKNGIPYTRVNAGYIDAVMAAGGLPVILPPFRKDAVAEIDALLDQVAGVVLTGGADMDPRRNG